jgi:hypothetical protein
MERKFIFKKRYECRFGAIPQGSELIEFRGAYYFNGGMVLPAYAGELDKIVKDPKLRNEYLEEVKVIPNKV